MAIPARVSIFDTGCSIHFESEEHEEGDDKGKGEGERDLSETLSGESAPLDHSSEKGWEIPLIRSPPDPISEEDRVAGAN